jgi:hypothetical protein
MVARLKSTRRSEDRMPDEPSSISVSRAPLPEPREGSEGSAAGEATDITVKALSRSNRRSLIRDGLTVASIVYLGWVWQYLLATGSHADVAAYWRAAQGDPYQVTLAGREGAWLYSPVAAQLLALAASMPLTVFVGALLAASLVAAVFLIGPALAALTLLTPLPFVWQDLSSGNIHLLLAAAVVLGFRFPAAWSFVLLTKVTPGIGLLWFAVRGEWKSLGIALGVTVALAVGSFVLAPSLWGQWIEVLRANTSSPPGGLSIPVALPIRLLLAAALVWWGATNDQAWTVPLAAMVALPIIWIFDGFAMLLGVVSVLRRPIHRKTPVHAAPFDT